MSDLKDTLAALLDATAAELAKRIKEGTASAADMAVAVKLLKDNGINADSTRNPALGSLAQEASRKLPFMDPDDYPELRRTN